VLIGMQLRPIWARLEAGGARTDALVAAVVVLAVTIAARFTWVMAYGALMRWRIDRAAASGRPMKTTVPRPTVGGGIVIS
jgi:monovalent cation/hydrogen antiporter